MSKEKYYCARCNKEFLENDHYVYASDVDHNLICKDCFAKEQPKYLIDKITDLEAKLAEKDELIENYKMGYTGKIWKQQNNEISILKSIVKDQDKEIEQLKQQLAEKEKETAILEKSLECACSDLQSSGNAYINAIEAVKGNDVILPVENAMQIEYEIALSELGIVKRDNMPETYQSKQSKDILQKDKIELLEKVKEFCETNCDKCDDLETGAYCGKVIGLDNVLYMGDMSLYEYIDTLISEIKGEK